jgi:hypothetical protein
MWKAYRSTPVINMPRGALSTGGRSLVVGTLTGGATGVRLCFSTARAGRVRIVVHDLAGHVVKSLMDRETGAGVHTVTWDGGCAGGAAAPGCYEAAVFLDDCVLAGKFILTR